MINFSIKYPFYCLSGICLLFFLTAGIFFNNAYISISEISYILVTFFIATSIKNSNFRISFILANLIFLLFFLLFNLNNRFLLIIELLQILSLFYDEKKHITKKIIFSIISSSFLLHLFYIQQIDVDFRQHDLTGIITYMTKITENGLNWKDFNPWNMYYAFHQPLHFIIFQYLYLFNKSLYTSSALAYESLQYLSLFYVTSISILAVKILRLLNFRNYTLYALVAFISFNPTLTLFSGYISNDVSVLFWSTFSMYFLLTWYKKDKAKYIILSSVCFGLGTLSKLSILLYVPAIGILFLCKLIYSKNKEQTIKQLCVFLIIAIPLSLVWIIRNHVLFDMQFYNIPDTSPQGQNFNSLSLWDRILDFSMIFKPFINAPFIADPNIFLAIIKTELFGEWDFSLINKLLIIPATLIYFISITIKTIVFLGAFYLIYRKNKRSVFNMFFVIIYFATLGYLVKYALDYPYICSTDYRLFTSLLFSEAVILGNIAKNKATSTTLLIAISFYVFLSTIIYIVAI